MAISGRTVIVTGASSGNGRAIAVRLANDGYRVVCADLRPDTLPVDTTSIPIFRRTSSSRGEAGRRLLCSQTSPIQVR